MQSQADADNAGNEFLHFSDEDKNGSMPENKKSLKILVVDDDEDVHILTRLVLRGYEFEGESITLMSAFSGEETRNIMAENPDIAVILLDVIMEDEYTGLELVKYIRKELNNSSVRIILRTGQPGGALERKVVSSYEIDDYKTKTELTSDKLFTSITTALRAYRDITAIRKSRDGLRLILECMPVLFSSDSLSKLSENILEFINVLFTSHFSGKLSDSTSSFLAVSDNNEFRIIAATGNFKDNIGQPVLNSASDIIPDEAKNAVQLKTDITQDDFLVRFFELNNSQNCLIFIKSGFIRSKEDIEIVTTFLNNAKLALNRFCQIAGSISR